MDRKVLSSGVDGGARRVNTGITDVARWLLVKILIVGSKGDTCRICTRKDEYSMCVELQACRGSHSGVVVEDHWRDAFRCHRPGLRPGARLLLNTCAETLHFWTDSRLYSYKRFFKEDCTTSELKGPGLDSTRPDTQNFDLSPNMFP